MENMLGKITIFAPKRDLSLFTKARAIECCGTAVSGAAYSTSQTKAMGRRVNCVAELPLSKAAITVRAALNYARRQRSRRSFTSLLC